MVGADVVAARHETLHDQGKAHGVEQSTVMRDTIATVHAWVLGHKLLIHELPSPDKVIIVSTNQNSVLFLSTNQSKVIIVSTNRNSAPT